MNLPDPELNDWVYALRTPKFFITSLCQSILQGYNEPVLGTGYRYLIDMVPKKRQTLLAYESGRHTVGWGIQLHHGVNHSFLGWVFGVICALSILAGIICWTFTKNAASGFSISSWIIAVASLGVTVSQIRR